MSDEAARYRGYASPHEAIDVAAMEAIAVTHYRRALRTFVSRHGALITERGSKDLVDVFGRWFDGATAFETVWHVSFGKMREVIAEQFRPATPAEVILSAARLGLRLCETGTTGTFEVALESPHRFRWGRYTLPACDRLAMNAEGGACTLTLSLGVEERVVRLVNGDSGWKTDGAEPIPTLETGGWTLGVLLPDTPEGRENMEHALVVDDAVHQQIIAGYQAAFNVLREYAPVYLPFVQRLLRHLVPVQPAPGGYIGGGSLRDNPGTVKLPFEREVVGLSANLGHECAHQHYFLLRGAGRVDDGSDLTLYDSAFVEGSRDLPSLVLTYHAFANEAIVLRTCEKGGIPDPYAGERAELLRQNLEPLEEILSSSQALTPLGRALFQPVADELHRAFR